MAQIVKLRRSSVSGQKPTNSNLQLGELALNTTDGKVYMAKSGSLGPTVEELISTNTVNTGSIHLIGSISASHFTGAFKGDGSELYNIPASGVTGLNLTRIADGNATASISNTDGLKINTNTEITGSLIVSSGSAVFDASLQLTENSSLILNSGSNLYVYDGGIISGTFKGNGALLTDLPYATTASNQFFGDQTITGSVVITQNLTVLGSSSISYITSSQLDVATSFITVNVYEPAERFGGIKVYDSGSSSATASLAWDSLQNHWVYQNSSGSSYSGGMLLSGPRNTGSLGEEVGLISGRIAKSVGGDHLDNSIISETGTTINIDGNLNATSLTGSIDFENLTNVPTLVSGSEQIEITGTTGYSTFSSSISTSIGELSSSIATTTNLLDGRIDSLETESGSIRSDFNSFTSSYTTGAFTGSFIGDGVGLYNIPASGVTGLQLDKIISGNASASIDDTGLRVNRDVYIDGTLTVNELHIDYVTSSVLYQSGSTKFGDTTDDTHQFTGSVYIDGNLNVDSITGSIDFSNITNKPTLVSGSSQISYTGITDVPNGIVSSSSQIVDLGFTTTSSFESFTSSYNTDSQSFDSRINTFTASINSLNSFSSSVVLTSQTSSMTVLSASYAVTAAFALNAGSGGGGATLGSYALLEQTTGSTTWSFEHNTGQRYPIFQVFNGSGEVIIPTQIRTIDENSAEIIFGSAQTGTAIASLGGGNGTTQEFTNSALWTVDHNLGTDYPDVTIWDSNRNIIFPNRIESVDSNQIKVYFSVPVSGHVSVSRGGHILSGSGGVSSWNDLQDIPSGLVSGSDQLTGSYDTRYVLSGSITQTTWDNIANKPAGIVSESIQVVLTGTTGYSTFSSSIATTDFNQNGRLDSLESTSASLLLLSSSIDTALEFTGSNVTIKGDFLVKGTTTTVNSTTLDIGDNIISLNGTGATNAGLVVRDVTNPNTASGSLLWDSTNDYWIAGALGSEEKIVLVGEFNTYTSSIDSSIGGINNFTNSLNSYTASTNLRIGSLETESGSIRGDFNSYTSSNNGRVNSLETESGSIRTDFHSFTSSYTTSSFTGSFIGDGSGLTNLSNITGSVGQVGILSSNKTISGSLFTHVTNQTFGLGTDAVNNDSPERLMVDNFNSYNIATFQTSQQETYAEVNIKNFGSGSSSSADLVIWNNVSTPSSSFLNLGINSSNYDAGYVGYGGDGYLFNHSNDLYIGSMDTFENGHGHVHIFGGGMWDSSSISIYSDGTIGINTDKENPSASTIPSSGGGYAVEISGSVNFRNGMFVTGSVVISGSLDISDANLGGSRYLHTQASTSATWSITHNLGYDYPNVTVYDGSNNKVMLPADVTSVDANTTEVTFATPEYGYALVSVGGISTSSADRYLHTQSSATGSWVIDHNIGYKYVTINVYDQNDEQLIPQKITAVSVNRTQIDFATPTSGNAIITVGGPRSTSIFTQTGSFYTTQYNIGITGSLVVSGDVDASSFNTTSDRTLKTNLERIEGALDKIDQLNGYTFDWISDYSDDKTRQIGMVANEVHEVQPELISKRSIMLGGKEEEIMLLDYSKVTALLIEGIKELKDRVSKLENKRKRK